MKETSKENKNRIVLNYLQKTTLILLLPLFGLSQPAQNSWNDLVSLGASLQAKPVAFSIEKKNRSMHPLKKAGEYHYLLHYEVNRKEGNAYAQLMYTDLLKGNFIGSDTANQRFVFIHPDTQLIELLTYQFRNPSAIFDTVYNENSYQAFHSDLVKNDDKKKATLFLNKKTGQMEFLMVTNLNPDKPVTSDQPASLRFSFSRIKGVFTLTQSNYHFIENDRGILYMKTINYNYLF